MITKSVAEINKYVGSSVNPMATPDQIYELYSVPSFESGSPEIVSGADVGSTKVIVEEGDILICKINPRINRVWVVHRNTEHPLLASSEWIVVRNASMNSDYLKWYFSSPIFRTLLTSQVTGIGGSLTRAQPKQVAKYPVPIPSRDEQDYVADILTRIDNLMHKYQQQIIGIEQLVKSRFIELFGEPLSNQKGWQTMSIMEVAPIKSQRGNLADEVWLLNLDAVEAQTGTVLFKHRVQSGEINASTVYFTTESVLYSKLRPYLNKVVMPDEDGVATSEMIPMYPLADRLNRAYLCYWLRSDAFVKHISEKVAGAKMPRVSMDYFRSLVIEMPPLELQEEFATFVEQVDKSKLTIQQSLEKLETLKKALMQQYFG